jgi:hypothetical protein
MTNVVLCVSALLLLPGAQKETLQEFNVSGIQCQYIATRVTPEMVQRDVEQYIDTCVRWEGRVFRIAEADPNVPVGKAWVIPIEGRFAYTGYTLLKIDLAPSGRIEEYSKYSSLSLCDYLYSHGDLDIRIGEFVSFAGRILGISKKPDPAHQGSFIGRTLIGITEIHKLRSNIPLKAQSLPG